jgi:hypothetical protein
MARAVYSKCFLQVAAGTGGLFDWPVPIATGDVAILKHMSVWFRDSHPAGILGDALTVSLDNFNVWTIKGPTIINGVYQWTGWEVFTEELKLLVLPTAFHFRASGTLLTPT